MFTIPFRPNTRFLALSLLMLLIVPIALAAPTAPVPPTGSTSGPLSRSERDKARFHLDNLYNEMDLLIQNRKVDHADLLRQEKDLKDYRVYERIPFQRDLPGLEKELKKTARETQVQLLQVEKYRFTSPRDEVPSEVFSDEKRFQFSENQLIETISFQAVVRGSKENVQQWIKNWPDTQLRFVESDRNIPKQINKNTYKIEAHAYRFRKVQFPKLVSKNPRKFLPRPSSPTEEPILWSLIHKIDALSPRVTPYYQSRSQFLLNDAHLNFFLSKVKAS